jgi:iron complex outermembrane receptor protein
MSFQQKPVMRLSVLAVACHVAALSAGSAYAQSASEVAPSVVTTKGNSQVIITGKKLGMGLMVTEDAPKARSTITAEELEKQRPTGNAYEALEMLPAVNSYNHDATGLFGGGMTLRGFNSDQIGATINGVPVNDSGSFSVFPQEYVDTENTCSQFVTQGSTDVDSPQVGATGGNFGIRTCNPENAGRVRLMQTIGQLDMKKSFIRIDSGKLKDNRSKFFVSLSHAETDKWKGRGMAKRDHVDAGFNWDLDRFNYVHATLLFNDALNNNIQNPTLAELKANGYNWDFSETFPGHAPARAGLVDVDPVPAPQYYQLATNPFRNAIFSAEMKARLTPDLDLKVLPYIWYGFGTGGLQQRAQRENAFLNPVTGTLTGNVDLNGDRDFRDTVIVANSSVTKTFRPGITSSLTYTLGAHEILGGFWYERARHQQTGSMVHVGNDGQPDDYFLQNDAITRADGSRFQSRDWMTISTAYQGFLQDTISLKDDTVKINVGVRVPYIKRDFTNFLSEGNVRNTTTNTSGTYTVERTYKEVLPQLGARWRFTPDDQIFASVAKNVKAPPNFVFSNVGSNVTVVNGKGVLSSDVQAETSVNTDIGYRHQDKKLIATFTVFFVDFKNRQATAFDPNTNVSSYTNVGDVKNRGFEIEMGNTPINGFSFYGSYGYSDSEVQDNLEVRKGVFLPTAGKEMPLTPKQKLSLSAEYQQGAFYTRIKARATAKQAGTLVNDEFAPGHTIFGLDGGYTFANFGMFKRPKLQFNISNLFNKQYRNPASTTVTNMTLINGVNPGSLRYYLGAPRFASATFSVDM